MNTLNGGKTMTAKFIEGNEKEVTVKQITVGDYKKCFPMVDDEIELTGFVCGLMPPEMNLLTPESYEQLWAAVREVNEKGFFTYATRQLDRAQKQMEAMPPEMLKVAMQSAPALKSQSPGLPQRRG